jgi:uncharacterized membrane protein
MKGILLHWRANFLAGLAIVLPAVITVAVVRWMFETVANVTDILLFFLPRAWTHQRGGEGPMQWYWSLVALLVGILIATLIGRSARYYAGKQLIQWMDSTLLRIPLLNKIYGTIKQVNDAFSTSNKTAFKQVVLVEYPRPGVFSLGFITSEDYRLEKHPTDKKMVWVFIPTTPNPTGGFLLLLTETEVTRLEMSVPDGIKFIISLGAIVPEPQAHPDPLSSPSAWPELTAKR